MSIASLPVSAPDAKRPALMMRPYIGSLGYVLIICVAAALYIPCRGHTSYHADSIGFARSISHFDLANHQPHIPGYPLYVVALRAVKLLTGVSDIDCILLLSVTATMAAAILFFRVASSWLDRWQACCVSLLLMTSPVVWFNAEISMSYSFLLLGSTATALATLRVLEGRAGARYLAPAVWGIAAGFRQDLGVMLAPLVIYGYRDVFRKSKRQLIVCLLIAVCAVAAWLIPLIARAGGPHVYFGTLRRNASQSGPLIPLHDGDILTSLTIIVRSGLAVIIFAVIGCLGALPLQAATLARVLPPTMAGKPVVFLTLWALPGFLLHAMTWVDRSGYILAYLPALILFCVLPASKECSGRRGGSRAFLWSTLLIAGIGLQASFFLLTPQQQGRFTGHWLTDNLLGSFAREPTLSRIRKCDAIVDCQVQEIRARYPSESTLLLVPVGGQGAMAMPTRALYAEGLYYLAAWPQRVLYTVPDPSLKRAGFTVPAVATVTGGRFVDARSTNIVTIPRDVRWLVWFCDVAAQPYEFDPSWYSYELDRGVHMVVAELRGDTDPCRFWGPFEFRQEELEPAQ